MYCAPAGVNAGLVPRRAGLVPSKAGLVPTKAGFSAASGLDVGVVPVVLRVLKLKPVKGAVVCRQDATERQKVRNGAKSRNRECG